MHRLTTLRIEITDRCPLACAHCSVSAGPGKRGTISSQAALGLMEQFAQQGGGEIVMTGGEPLTHPDCAVFLEEAKRLGLKTTLFSMGVMDKMQVIGEDLLARLATSVDICRVSLHAADAATHDSLTMIAGSFEATCRAVKKMGAAGITVYATFFAHPGNVDGLSGVAELCERLGVGELRILTVVAQGRAAGRLDSWSVGTRQITQAIAAANEVPGVRVRLGEAARARSGGISNCHAIWEELVVNWIGWISPCHSVEPWPSLSDLDNALRTPLGDVLRLSPRLLRCREFAKKQAETCAGGCQARLALLNQT